MSTAVRTKKNLAYSLIEKVSKAGLVFVSLVVVGRYFGPEHYGELNYILAVVTYFQILAVFGLDQILVAMLVDSENKEKLFWESSRFKIITSFVSLAVYFFYLIFDNQFSARSAFFGLTIFTAVFDNGRIFLESENSHSVVAKIELAYQVLSAGLKILFCFLKLDISILYAVFILDFLIPKIALMYAAKAHHRPASFEHHVEKGAFKKFTSVGIYYCLSHFFVILYMKIDQVMIGNMMTMTDLGNYSAAVRLADAWYFLPVVIAGVFFPQSIKHKDSEVNHPLQIIFDLTLWASLIIVAGAFIFSDNLYNLLFGGKYNIDRGVINLLFVSGIFISLSISTNSWLNLRGLKEIVFIRTLVGALSNIVLNYIWIPKYGLLGCAWATTISYALTCLCTFFAKDSKECFIYIVRSFNIFQAVSRTKKLLLKSES